VVSDVSFVEDAEEEAESDDDLGADVEAGAKDLRWSQPGSAFTVTESRVVIPGPAHLQLVTEDAGRKSVVDPSAVVAVRSRPVTIGTKFMYGFDFALPSRELWRERPPITDNNFSCVRCASRTQDPSNYSPNRCETIDVKVHCHVLQFRKIFNVINMLY
jgi:hypothetical protein